MKKTILLFLILTILLCSCSIKNEYTTSFEDIDLFAYHDRYVKDFINTHMKSYSEAEAKANEELMKRTDKKRLFNNSYF